MAPRQDNEINAIWRGDMFPVTYLPVGMSGGVLERGYIGESVLRISRWCQYWRNFAQYDPVREWKPQTYLSMIGSQLSSLLFTSCVCSTVKQKFKVQNGSQRIIIDIYEHLSYKGIQLKALLCQIHGTFEKSHSVSRSLRSDIFNWRNFEGIRPINNSKPKAWDSLWVGITSWSHELHSHIRHLSRISVLHVSCYVIGSKSHYNLAKLCFKFYYIMNSCIKNFSLWAISDEQWSHRPWTLV